MSKDNGYKLQSKCRDIVRKWNYDNEPKMYLNPIDAWRVWLNVLKYLIDDY